MDGLLPLFDAPLSLCERLRQRLGAQPPGVVRIVGGRFGWYPPSAAPDVRHSRAEGRSPTTIVAHEQQRPVRRAEHPARNDSTRPVAVDTQQATGAGQTVITVLPGVFDESPALVRAGWPVPIPT